MRTKKTKVVKDEIRARLTIYGLNGLRGKELISLRNWLAGITKEINDEDDTKIYAKNYRVTLYKPPKSKP